MTAQLLTAIKEIEALPESEQDALALLLIQELHWEQSFKSSQDALLNLAKEALKEHANGHTHSFELR